MEGGEIPLALVDTERSLDARAQGGEHCVDATVPDTRSALTAAEVRSLAEFFLLLDRWDRMSTVVPEEATAPEQTAA